MKYLTTPYANPRGSRRPLDCARALRAGPDCATMVALRRAILLLLAVPSAIAFVCPSSSPRLSPPRHAPVKAFTQIIPVANIGLGCTLLYRAAATSGANAVVLASTGLLATLNLAVEDNARYASAKRALAKVENEELPLAKLAKQWYTAVRAQVFGQLAGLLYMARAATPAGVLYGAVIFMTANVAFFLLGAGDSKHDLVGVIAPMNAKQKQIVLSTDLVLLGAAYVGASLWWNPLGSFGKYVYATGCLIGAAEGLPKTVAAVKALAGRMTRLWDLTLSESSPLD